jgi:2-phosphosulfolactate phosphatase
MSVIEQSTGEMVSSDQPPVYVHLLPKLVPPGSLRGGVAVVVDVLRATTVMVHALAAGCQAVIPCAEVEEVRAVASCMPPGTVLTAGERGGLPIPGFDLGNSPSEFIRDRCAGKTVVMTTTNGTRAILASRGAERVYVASFANLAATVREISVKLENGDRAPLHIVCAGTEGYVSLEDSLFAGALLARLVATAGSIEVGHGRLGNDEAHLVLAEWLGVERSLKDRPLGRLLSRGRGGQNVQRIGLAGDIEAAAAMDCFNLVAELRRDPEPLRVIVI